CSLYSTIAVTPVRRAAWRVISASSQPQGGGRPVFTPTAPPVTCRYSPHLSSSSVGNGPAPTRVVYALTIPITRSMRVGPTPVPVHAPPAVGFELVTNG